MFIIGIIGAGTISDNHIQSYLQNENCRIKAIADLNLALASEKAKKYNIEKVYSSYEDILNDDEIDAVSILTPPFTHKTIITEALNCGKHVLCEKPPALNAIEAKEVTETAKKCGKLLMYAFCTRFTSQVSYLKKYIDSGKMGKIISAEVIRVRQCVMNAGWFVNKSKAGGGPLIDVAIHDIDSVMYLMGYPKPKAVLGVASDINKDLPQKIKGLGAGGYMSSDRNKYERDVENFASGYITFENGACLYIKTSTILNTVEQGRAVDICGEKAGVKMKPFVQGEELKMLELTDDNYFRDVIPKIANNDSYKAEIDHFVDCCLNGTECICKPEEAVRLMEIIDALYKSAETGEPVVF